MTEAPGQLEWLAALGSARAAGEACVLVTIAAARGASPREAGAKMLVRRDGGFAGTIGGGRLEHRALARAAELMAAGVTQPVLERIARGPALGQCCGGEVTLLLEPFGGAALRVALFGAGPVGRAVIDVLAGLPVAVDWIDSRADAFPPSLPPGMRAIHADPPQDEVADLVPGSAVVIMTHGHDLDLAIAAAALARGVFAYVGVIGSETKAARFRARLAPRALDPGKLRCPIGIPGLDTKHPRAVAIALAAELLSLAKV